MQSRARSARERRHLNFENGALFIALIMFLVGIASIFCGETFHINPLLYASVGEIGFSLLSLASAGVSTCIRESRNRHERSEHNPDLERAEALQAIIPTNEEVALANPQIIQIYGQPAREVLLPSRNRVVMGLAIPAQLQEANTDPKNPGNAPLSSLVSTRNTLFSSLEAPQIQAIPIHPAFEPPTTNLSLSRSI